MKEKSMILKGSLLVMVLLLVGFMCTGVLTEAAGKQKNDYGSNSVIKYDKNTDCQYIVVKTSDAAKQLKINKILKADFMAIVNSFDMGSKTAVLKIKAKGQYIKETGLFIATYTGYYNDTNQPYPNDFKHVSVINMGKACRVVYTDNKMLLKLKKAIKSGDFTCKTKDKELEKAQKQYLTGLDDTVLMDMLKQANFRAVKGKVKSSDTYLYQTKKTSEVILPTINALGDYAEISINR